LRILFLTQWFQPESFFKGLPFAKALREKGHDVSVLTGFPNYPGGKVYPGYRLRLYQREEMDGIKIHRVALYPSHDTSALRRILNYFSFAFSAFVVGPWVIGRPDVVYVYNLITLGPPAFFFRLLFGPKVVLDVQDLWPESVTNSGMLANKTALGILNRICNWIYGGADRITVLSPGFKEELIRRGIPAEKIDVVYNWFDETSIEIAQLAWGSVKPKEFSGKFVVLFAGAMGLAQGLDTVLDCARFCKTILPDVQFVLVGGGVDKQRLQKKAEDMALENVTFLPPRAQSSMGEIYAMADALLVHLKDDPLFRITIPSKTQAYLYIGKPIIMAMRGDAADLVRASGAGIVCNPEEMQGMLNGIRELHRMTEEARQCMGQEGHSYYMQNLSFKQGVARFERIIKDVAGRAI